MEKHTIYIRTLLTSKGIVVKESQEQDMMDFSQSKVIQDAINEIQTKQEYMIENWKHISKLKEIEKFDLILTNGTVGKQYEQRLILENTPLAEINPIDLSLNDDGIVYEPEQKAVKGIFKSPGEKKLILSYRIKKSIDEEKVYQKELKIIVNPDPKSLWRTLESNKDDPYWKEDVVSQTMKFGTRKLVMASKRGRSHAHEGLFRDDDYAATYMEENGWGVIAVADGAGSCKYSRKGSQLACKSVIEYFVGLPKELFDDFTKNILSEIGQSSEENQKMISSFCVEHIGKAAFKAQTDIKIEAESKQAQIKDYSTTLIFSLFRQFGEKYFIASFWVGDGGIGIYNNEPNSLFVMGTPDSGEFSGQTRFLTMSEIFADSSYVSRIKYKIIDGFSKLVLMTDGITDPKFDTESNLGKMESWNKFIDDLNGVNEDNKSVEFGEDLFKTESQLLEWMDFWSPGNHDDRTMAVLY